MAASFSDFMANKMLNVLGVSAIYISLHSGDPGEDGADELSGDGYARKPNTSTAADDQQITNTAGVTFGPASAEWDEATHFGMWSASVGGQFLCGGELDDPVTVPNLGSATFAAESLVVSLKPLA